jgi:hypothetical protein
MKVYILRDTDNNEVVKGNGIATILCLESKVVADREAQYLNHEAPSAPCRDKYLVETRTI